MSVPGWAAVPNGVLAAKIAAGLIDGSSHPDASRHHRAPAVSEGQNKDFRVSELASALFQAATKPSPRRPRRAAAGV